MFIDLFGPAIIVIRQGAAIGINKVHFAVEDQLFVIVGSVVGAGNDDPADPFFQRGLVDIVGHLHIGKFIPEAGISIVAGTGVGVADKTKVDNGIGPAEVGAVVVAVFVNQIRDLHTGDFLTRAVGRFYIEQDYIIALAQSRQNLPGHLAGRTGDDDFLFGHLPFLVFN